MFEDLLDQCANAWVNYQQALDKTDARELLDLAKDELLDFALNHYEELVAWERQHIQTSFLDEIGG